MKPVFFTSAVVCSPLPGEGVWWSGPGAASQQTGQGRPERSDGFGGAGARKGAARLNIQTELCRDLLTVLNSLVHAATPGVVLWVQCQNWEQHWGSDDRARQVGANQCSFHGLELINDVLLFWNSYSQAAAFSFQLLSATCGNVRNSIFRLCFIFF